MCNKVKVDITVNIQNILAIIFSIAGVVLIFLGFYAVPVGELSSSVELVLGELLAFIASVLGIDSYYNTRFSKFKRDNNIEEKTHAKN